MENYLYFAAADINTGGSTAAREGICVPASSYIGADPIGATTTAFYFNGVEGSDRGVTKVLLTHGSGNNKATIKGVMACVNASPHSGGFVVVADSDVAGTSKSSEYSPIFNGDVSTVAITEVTSGNDIAVSGTTYGVGAISTYSAPVLRRWTENGVIVTQLWVDLTGLGGKGTAADDVIGLPAGGAAYVYRNVVANNGIIFKYQISCIELPAAASGSATVDIDFNWNTSAVLAYDGAAGTSEVDMGGLAAGKTHMVDDPALTANDYLYLTEGDTAATDGVYNAGQFLFTFYGMPVDAN